MLSLSAATDLFLLRQLQHLRTLLEITCILWNSFDSYAHVTSFLLTPSLSRNPAGFAGARYIIEFVMTYYVILDYISDCIVIVYDYSM